MTADGDLLLRVYVQAVSDGRGAWLELPALPDGIEGVLRDGIGLGVDEGYFIADFEPCWYSGVLGSHLDDYSVESLNLMARSVSRARDLAVAGGEDGASFLDMLATEAEAEGLSDPSALAALASRARDVAETWVPYSLPASRRVESPWPDELYGAHIAFGLMGEEAFDRLDYCMDLKRLGSDAAMNDGVTTGATGFVTQHDPLVPDGPLPADVRSGVEAFAGAWAPEPVAFRPFDIMDIVRGGETVADYTLAATGPDPGTPVYQCVVGEGFDVDSDVFGLAVMDSLDETLRRIHDARAGMGDFDEVARGVMGVEPGAPDGRGDGPDSLALDLGYVLPVPLTSFQPRPTAASATDVADPMLLASDPSSVSRGV